MTTTILDHVEAALAKVRDEHRVLYTVGFADSVYREAMRQALAVLYGWTPDKATNDHVTQWLRHRHCTIAWHQPHSTGALVVSGDAPVTSPPNMWLALFPASDQDGALAFPC
ncbi:hypothetical protein [Streptomyces yaizuensis]|uniref:Uncharacterized protein n=1 Tax=Streptomyces yaizuensis TaxID=2989713 RepID=A0AA86IZ64_9ACTN|nr:hypothetical protein [Streptomyces sp. YSPA8]BDT39516.1 hypothetical protein SYYSPA8_36990 [Streptomyces sp. YSPA8]